MPSSDVSVIIPTYNRLSMLEEALASVYSQDFDGVVEIIVVDDNSQDGTSEVVSRKYPEIRLISFKQNVGAYVARNRALLEAKGKYIAFLDSDDLWETNYLKTQIAALKCKERGFCVSALVIWDTVKDQKGIALQKPDLDRYSSPIHHLLVSNFIITPSSVVFPRQTFDEVGLFDEKFKVGGDAELYIRCLLSGYNLIFTEPPVAIKREHGKDQLTNTKNLKLKQKCRFMRIDKFYALSEGRFDILPIRRIYAETHANFASQYFKKNDFLHWLLSSIAVAYNASPRYALSNMISDIRSLLKIGTKLRMMHCYIKNLFYLFN
jgi:glycosyltransferase involved in cell wall biosynthesis